MEILLFLKMARILLNASFAIEILILTSFRHFPLEDRVYPKYLKDSTCLMSSPLLGKWQGLLDFLVVTMHSVFFVFKSKPMS